MVTITNYSDHNLGEILERYFSNCSSSVYIISPFIENSVLEKILSKVDSKEVSIITSWAAKNLMAGVSSLDLYDLIKSKGWTLYVNNRLHAKIYSIGFNSCYLGSMNCTNKALYNNNGNIECFYFKESMDVGNRIELTKIINTSTLVDDRIYKQYKEWFDSVIIKNNGEIEDLNVEDLSPFYVFQLPLIEHPSELWNYILNPDKYRGVSDKYEHDLGIYTSGKLDYESETVFYEDLKIHFINHPFVSSVEKLILPTGTRFGEFRTKIREMCSDVPVPYAYELNDSVHYLYGWFTELFPEKYEYKIPGKRSECLFRVG